ncbi:hypothetical protein PRZ48_013164 [Zasmidium cellare]|uniref:SnoaL-like domain-containing protein n=1 Tax=Zasmidium cellare TaxID=395010 RepID=A0ABR0E3U6_ZASCE|nr:hypothetical protein PRZ48_013164 [Zasmidium cellare]
MATFLRRLSNPFENWHYRSLRIDDLLPQTKDHVFSWQLDATDFSRIDQDTILRAGISPNKTYAAKIFSASQKLGIIDPMTGLPDTSKIDRNLVKAMPNISVQKQRELVMLLFFWEEEITRWRLLESEEAEIKGRLEEEGQWREGARMELEHALRVVQAKKRVLPSLRDQSGRVIEDGEERLPSYAEARAMRHGCSVNTTLEHRGSLCEGEMVPPREQQRPTQAFNPATKTDSDQDFEAASAGAKSEGIDKLTPTETLMLELSRQFIAAINGRKFDAALALQDEAMGEEFGVAINFSAQLVNYPKMSDWHEYVEVFREIAAEWPEYHIGLISSTVSLDNVRDKADVFLLAEETGRPPGVRTVAPSRLEWLKVGQKWMLSKHLMFRGAEMDPMGAEG